MITNYLIRLLGVRGLRVNTFILWILWLPMAYVTIFPKDLVPESIFQFGRNADTVIILSYWVLGAEAYIALYAIVLIYWILLILLTCCALQKIDFNIEDDPG